MSVLIETTLGDIVIDLYVKERPRASLNFIKLCKMKYYNYCIFHYVQQNFIAQTGDPTGTGRGGESIFYFLYGAQAKYFEAEIIPKIKHRKMGTISMVNNTNDMHGSQFFLTLAEDLDYLDGKHTVFGEVAEGMDTIIKINQTLCSSSSRPYQDIRITHTIILDDPYDDPVGLQFPDYSPEPTPEQLKSTHIGADEEIDDTKGKTLEQLEEEAKDREARARATLLEMIGDIPDAGVRPPDNVLFVCKLNPVTTDEDLEIIFSRFGKIQSCEIIRDWKTGDSLQYGFVEFQNPANCEDAYFKMDNVLIDDRRIHVDFSQSVAKVKWKGKGQGVEYKDEKARQEFEKQRDYVNKDHDPTHSNDQILQNIKKTLHSSKEKHKKDKHKHDQLAKKCKKHNYNDCKKCFQAEIIKNVHNNEKDTNKSSFSSARKYSTSHHPKNSKKKMSINKHKKKYNDHKKSDKHSKY